MSSNFLRDLLTYGFGNTSAKNRKRKIQPFSGRTLSQEIAAQLNPDFSEKNQRVPVKKMKKPEAVPEVFDVRGVPKKLGEPIAKPGGEGTVYFLLGKPEILVKIYHPKKLAEHRQAYQEKIEAMIKIKDNFQKFPACWPLLSVYDREKNWIGYAMRRGIGAPMRYLAHAVAYRKHFPYLDRIMLLRYMIRFVQNIMILHEKGIFIGDYNMLNFLCDPLNDNVAMIDCDSYQLRIDGKFYPCPVGSPDLTPVEHHDKDFRNVVHTEKSENFSLAIILFECLMLGRHPYDVVGGDDPVTNLRTANFPYKKGNKGVPKGPWRNIWTHMPPRIKRLFNKTFTEGVLDPDKRVPAETWLRELSIYLADMQVGKYDKNINPMKKLVKMDKKPKINPVEAEEPENYID